MVRMTERHRQFRINDGVDYVVMPTVEAVPGTAAEYRRTGTIYGATCRAPTGGPAVFFGITFGTILAGACT